MVAPQTQPGDINLKPSVSSESSANQMNENQLSRFGSYGRAMDVSNQAGVNTPIAPNAKYFFVGAATLPSYADFLQEFKGFDADGSNRIFPTIAAAIADAGVVAARGDVLYVLPGHTETIVGAAGVALSKSGVSVIGLGNGGLRPTVTFTTSTAASFDVTAASVLVQNIVFVCGIDAQIAMNNVTAADVTFDSCEWRLSNGTVGAVLGILTAATADRLRVTNPRFIGPATNTGTTCTAAIQHESGVDYVIQKGYFAGKMTQAIKNVATVLRGLIDDNRFVIGTGTVAITMAAASTPFITNNRFNVPSGTAPIVAAAGFVAGNTYSAAAGVTAGTASTF